MTGPVNEPLKFVVGRPGDDPGMEDGVRQLQSGR